MLSFLQAFFPSPNIIPRLLPSQSEPRKPFCLLKHANRRDKEAEEAFSEKKSKDNVKLDRACSSNSESQENVRLSMNSRIPVHMSVVYSVRLFGQSRIFPAST